MSSIFLTTKFVKAWKHVVETVKIFKGYVKR